MRKFKAGDVVVCKACWHGQGPGWNEGMYKYLGRDLTVVKYAGMYRDHPCYRVKEDDGMYFWDEYFMDFVDEFEGNV